MSEFTSSTVSIPLVFKCTTQSSWFLTWSVSDNEDIPEE